MTIAGAIDLSRRDRRKLASRERMLDAALEVFGRKGYHRAGMQEIAARADLAVGTLYNFFENKEDLYKALLTNRIQRLTRALIDSLDEGEDEFEKLMNYLRVKGEIYGSNVEMARVYVSQAPSAGFSMKAGVPPEVAGNFDELNEKMAAIFESGIERGVFAKLPPEYMARSLASMSNSFILLWLEEPEKHPYAGNIATIASIFFGGVLTEDRKERLEDL